MLQACQSTSEPILNQNLTVDSSYLIAKGGDPRGTFIPNDPFLFTLNPTDSVVISSATGRLEMSGPSNDSGAYRLELTSQLEGRFSGINYTKTKPISDTTDGTWWVLGDTLFVSNGNLTRAVTFSSDSKGLYIIYPVVTATPPIQLGLLLIMGTPGVSDSTIWIFKRQ